MQQNEKTSFFNFLLNDVCKREASLKEASSTVKVEAQD